MSRNGPVDIELKELSSSYPSLQDEREVDEERKSIRITRIEQRNVPNPSPPRPSTVPSALSRPIAPISSSSPRSSFIEQQRLRNSAPPQAPIVPVQLNPANQRFSVPNISGFNHTPGFRAINCSGCQGIIQYPCSASIVFCNACHVYTAARPLINIVCYYCRESAYYSAELQIAKCKCGTQYAIRPAY